MWLRVWLCAWLRVWLRVGPARMCWLAASWQCAGRRHSINQIVDSVATEPKPG